MSQIEIPPSFIALYLPPGQSRLRANFEEVLARYELCEDMANLLTETAQTMQFSLGITETDVLAKVLQGLQLPDSGFSGDEAQWVLRRLAELLNWAGVEALLS